MRKAILRSALVIFVAAVTLPWAALARGGGGQHYSSGGHSSSGGGAGYGYGGGSRGAGSGGGIGTRWEDVPENVWDDVKVFWGHPTVWGPTLGMIALYLWARRRALGTPTRPRDDIASIPPALQNPSKPKLESWVTALRKADSEFTLARLYSRANRVFHLLQQGWFARSLEEVRPFLSDAMHRRFVVQLDLMARQGVRNAICDWRVLEAQLIGVDQSDCFDTAHVRIRAQMRDTDVRASASDEQAIAAAKKVKSEPFVEVWSFVRRSGAKTRSDANDSCCPNCGAPYKGGASNVCGYCQAIVNSGNYDWTLAEITQEIEWVRGHGAVDGLAAAREGDSALSVEVLEDRASLVFWRWIEAQVRGEPGALSKIAASSYLETFRAELDSLSARHRRWVFVDCAVGAVDTRLVRRQGDYDQVHLEVRWSAQMGLQSMDAPTPKLPSLPQRSVFVLMRKSGAKTRTDSGLATSRCAQCGAPLADDGAPSCSFCGAKFGTAEHDWMLVDARTYESWCALERQRMDPALRAQATFRGAEVVTDRTERQRLLSMMAILASSDGQVDASERQLLKFCADRWAIAWRDVELALDRGPDLFERLLPPSGSEEAKVVLETLIRCVQTDAKVTPEELRLLETAASRLGLREQLPLLLACT